MIDIDGMYEEVWNIIGEILYNFDPDDLEKYDFLQALHRATNGI